MSKILDFLVLPGVPSAFEIAYLRKLNRIGLGFLAAHVPIFVLIAWLNQTGPAAALVLTTLVLLGPVVAWLRVENGRTISMTYGVAAMCMGGLLAHFGQGPVQIEMHFYFFAVLAMLAVFANPLVIVAAAMTVALHHMLLWLALPKSVFNYDAPVWVVGLHAAFVVLESVATCFIARSFFDNVIGLEKVVASRTLALDQRNQKMRIVLDNVRQGFATIDRMGTLATERSAAFDAWLGPVSEGATFFDLVATRDPDFAARSRLAWDEVRDAIMPLSLTIDQMPSLLRIGGAEMSIEYLPVGDGEAPLAFLVVVTDVSAQRQRARDEMERREGLKLFERLLADRSGCASFFETATEQVSSILGTALEEDFATYKRVLHTLKGNAAIFGLESVAMICHDLETFISDEGCAPPAVKRRVLADRWASLQVEMDRLLGARRHVIEVEPAEHHMLEQAVRRGIPKDALLRQVHELKLDSTQRRLDGLAEHARHLAERLDKGEIDVTVEGNGLRVDAAHWGPFWASFVHALRNAVDHGLEGPDERVEAGKSPAGRLSLRTFVDGQRFIVEIEDDGRGIDFARLADKGRIRGLEGVSGEALLFADGVSTAENVTDLSGRGVGLGALRDATIALGGTLEVTTEIGVGTTLRMVFSEHSMTPELYAEPSPPAQAA